MVCACGVHTPQPALSILDCMFTHTRDVMSPAFTARLLSLVVSTDSQENMARNEATKFS